MERGTHPRVALIVFASAVVPVGFATALPLSGAVVFIGLICGAYQAWSATLYSTVSDIFPSRSVASITGLCGLAGSLGGMIFPLVCGEVLDAAGPSGYVVLFIWAGGAYWLALGLHRILRPSITQVKIST